MPHDTTTPPSPSASSGTETPPPHPGQAGQHRFFTWMRGLGIVRQDAWIGGVCGGIATRLGIDPVIVRGIAVVVAVLGGPVFLLYAAGWLLLPDANDGIHLESLLRGVFEPPIVGIGVLALITFLPIAQGVWWAGAQFWGEPFWPQSLGRALWSLIVLGLIVAFVVWAARRSNWTTRGGAQVPGSRTASASAPATPGKDATGYGATDGHAATGRETREESAERSAEKTPTASVPAAFAAASPPPTAPTEPPTGATTEEFAAWRQQQQAWRQQHAAWRQQQDADQRAIRAQRSAETRAKAQAAAARADAARRARRSANPRTSGAYVAITLGAALIAGAVVAALAAGTRDWRGHELTMGLATATLVVGAAMVIAGIVRRRSGFLSFVAIVLTLGTLITAPIPAGRQLVGTVGPYAISNYQTPSRFAQLAGKLDVTAYSELTPPGTSGGPQIVDVWQGVGRIDVNVPADLTVRVEATLAHGSIYYLKTDADYTTRPATDVHETVSAGGDTHVSTFGTGTSPDVIVKIWQGRGEVDVYARPAEQVRTHP